MRQPRQQQAITSRRLIAAPRLKTKHRIGSNECFDRGRNTLRYCNMTCWPMSVPAGMTSVSEVICYCVAWLAIYPCSDIFVLYNSRLNCRTAKPCLELSSHTKAFGGTSIAKSGWPEGPAAPAIGRCRTAS